MEKFLFYRNPTKFRICLDFTANKFYVILFSLFEAFATKETMVAADNDGTGNRKIGAEFAIQENKAYFCTQVTL